MEYKEIQNLRELKDNLRAQLIRTGVILEDGCLSFIDSQMRKYGKYEPTCNGESWTIKIQKKYRTINNNGDKVTSLTYEKNGYITFSTENRQWCQHYRKLEPTIVTWIIDILHNQFKNED